METAWKTHVLHKNEHLPGTKQQFFYEDSTNHSHTNYDFILDPAPFM